MLLELAKIVMTSITKPLLYSRIKGNAEVELNSILAITYNNIFG
jgi:hypothetical protein